MMCVIIYITSKGCSNYVKLCNILEWHRHFELLERFRDTNEATFVGKVMAMVRLVSCRVGNNSYLDTIKNNYSEKTESVSCTLILFIRLYYVSRCDVRRLRPIVGV